LNETAKDIFDGERLSKGTRWALFIMAVGGIFYLGGSTARGIIENDLVEIGTLKFRQDIPFDAEKEIYNLLARISLLVVLGYLLAFIGFWVFIFKSKLKMKEHPNALMAVILFVIFIPIEFYTSYLDLKFFLSYVDFQLQLFLGSDPGPLRDEMRKLFVERVGGLGGLSVIALLSYYSAIGVLIFRPIKTTKSEKTLENAEVEDRSVNS
jgi:amino acid transporter